MEFELWPQQTELEIRLYGKLYHHEIHCNASRREPMGSSGCSCEYSTRRRERHLQILNAKPSQKRSLP